MTRYDNNHGGYRTRLRWLVRLGILVVIATATGIYGAAWFLNTERLRGDIEGRIEAFVGLPASVASVGVTLFPVPRLALYDVRAGDAEIHGRAAVCALRFDLRRLVRREIHVAEMRIHDARVVLPAEPRAATDRFNALLADIQTRQQDRKTAHTPRVTTQINVIDFRELRVLLGDRAVGSGNVRFENTTSPVITVSAEADLAGPGDNTHLSFRVRLDRHEGQISAIAGDAAFSMTASWPIGDATPPVSANAQLHIEVGGTGFDDLAFAITGDVAITGADLAIAGAMHAGAWCRGETVIINDLTWRPPGLILEADATVMLGELRPAINIHQLTIRQPVLQSLLHVFDTPGLAVTAAPDGYLSVARLLVGTGLDDPPRLVSGRLEFQGLTLQDGQRRPLLENMGGAMELEEGRLRMEEVAGVAWDIAGTLEPDFEKGTIAFALQGAGHADARHVEAVFPAFKDGLDAFSAEIVMDRLVADYHFGQRRLDIQDCAGHLANGALRYRGGDGDTVTALAFSHGAFRYEDNRIHIEELHTADSRISGSVRLAAQGNGRVVQASGDLALAELPWAWFWPEAPLSEIRGRLALEGLTVTLPEGGGQPLNLEMTGMLNDAGVRLEMPGYDDRLQAVSGPVVMDGEQMRFTLAGDSERLGAFRCEGAYRRDSGQIGGEIVVDLGRALASFSDETEWGRSATSLAKAYFNDGGFSFAGHLPEDDRDGMIEMRYQGASLLYLQATLARASEGMRLRERSLQAEAPLSLIVEILNQGAGVAGTVPFPLESEGTAQLRYEQSDADGPFTISMNATPCRLAYPPFLVKRPETPFQITVQGTRGQPHRIDLTLDRHSLSFQVEGDRYAGQNIAVDLSALSRLLPEETRLDGNVQVSFTTRPGYVWAQLEDVRGILPPDLDTGRVNGIVEYRGGGFAGRELRFQGKVFDGQLDLVHDGRAWRATVRGERMDLNQLIALNEAVARLQGDVSPSDAGMTMPDSYGALDLQLGEVVFRRGAVRQFAASAQVTPEAITVDDLAFRVGSGGVSGTARLLPETEGTRRPVAFYAEVQVDSVELQQVDGLIFDQPRHFHGLASGPIETRIPSGREGYRRMDGNFNLALADGAFGKLGFATRITTLLRGTEVLRLRAPSLRDEGLTYDSAKVNVAMRQGVAYLDNCVVASPSYQINASGTVDFARMQTDTIITVNALESVAGIVELVPLIGRSATALMRGATLIRLRATGSPFDIRLQPEIMHGVP